MNFFNANPDRGAILPQFPLGIPTLIPVFINSFPWLGTTLSSLLKRSQPAARIVPFLGSIAFQSSRFTKSFFMRANSRKLNLMIDSKTTVGALKSPGFADLTEIERRYAYHFSRASWEGSKICFFQRSFESPGLLFLLVKVFQKESPQQIGYRMLTQGLLNVEEVKALYAYIAGFFNNCGNYLSFGDTKFVPQINKDKFWLFLEQSKAYEPRMKEVWEQINEYVYNKEKPYALIDLPEKEGCNSYYSNTLTAETITQLDELLASKNISVLNTRAYINNEKELVVLAAAAKRNDRIELGQLKDSTKVYLQYGDFNRFLEKVGNHLQDALKYTSSNHQNAFLDAYVKHFNTGDMELHKESQKHWIQDKGPVIETNIGFIETYLDPMKVRAEFEGFVAIQNKHETLILNELVANAPKFIAYLPWPKEFEISEFKKPDFTSLEVITFASSGTPIGINIPNYDDIRQNIGFKNVNLGNVYGKPNRENIRFLNEDQTEIFMKYYQESLFLVVALHELIGHGSGKLLTVDEKGELNFDGEMVNPLTKSKISNPYKQNENWHARFGELSGAYEECKADGVALYLSTFDDVNQVLLPGKSLEERNDIVKAAWLDIIYGSFKGLQYYSPDQKKWGQPHILASYVLFQAMRKEDPEMIRINAEEGKLSFDFDFGKIWTSGKEAVGKLLRGLQIYKSTGEGELGMKFFEQYTVVDEQMVQIRDIVLANKTPRKLELQPDLKLVNEKVVLVEYEETFEGVIESYVDHFRGQVDDVYEEFVERQKYFKPQ